MAYGQYKIKPVPVNANAGSRSLTRIARISTCNNGKCISMHGVLRGFIGGGIDLIRYHDCIILQPANAGNCLK